MNQRTTTIAPLTKPQQREVVEQTNIYIEKASQLFNIKIKPVDIKFDLRGRSAGMFRVTQRIGQRKREIRYNSFIFSKYYEDNFTTTVPHEVAHYVSDVIHGLKNIKPHGREWQGIMHAFGADAAVTANYDLSGISVKKQTLHPYLCSCREHQLTSTRHNRIHKKRFRYYCNFCKQILQYKQDVLAIENN